jgi:hypothetical protein
MSLTGASVHRAVSARIVPLVRLDLVYAPWAWPFAQERRADIEAHFEARRRRASGIWNGRVLLLRSHAIEDGVLRGAFFDTDFASFLAWRDWGAPDPTVLNCFALGALRANDGAFLLGVMGAHTASAGSIYFPCGTPDLGDVVDDRVDLEGSIRREIAEETGLGGQQFHAVPGWHAILDGSLIAVARLLDVPHTGAEMHARARAHLAGERTPELADVRLVRGPADLDPRMPGFVTAFLTHLWR